jgi:hypothetical protein
MHMIRKGQFMLRQHVICRTVLCTGRNGPSSVRTKCHNRHNCLLKPLTRQNPPTSACSKVSSSSFR